MVDFVGWIDIELQSVLNSSSSATLITCRAVVYACGGVAQSSCTSMRPRAAWLLMTQGCESRAAAEGRASGSLHRTRETRGKRRTAHAEVV